MNISRLFLLSLCILWSILTYSQDIIYTKKKGEIKAKVVEIGTSEIKYKNYDNQDGPVNVIRKAEVRKIQYQNGKEDIIVPDKYSSNQEEQIIDKQNAIKFQVFSPLAGHLAFCYERVLKPGFNLETKIGIIGAGVQPFRNNTATGGYAKIGAKFLFGQDFVIDGMRMSHPLKGGYAAFQVAFSHFSEMHYDYSNYNSITYTYEMVDIASNSFAFNIILGKQWILGNKFTLDAYAGIGYGAVSRISSNPDVSPTGDIFLYNPFHFSHYYFGKDMPMTLTSGLSLGYIF